MPRPNLEQLTQFEANLRSTGNVVAKLGSAGLFLGVVTLSAPVAIGSFAVGFAGHYGASVIERVSTSRAAQV